MLRASTIRKLRQSWEFAWFTVPAVALLILFVELPFLMSVAYSFTKWNGLDKVARFVGLENYRALLTDEMMLKTLGFTFAYSLSMVVLVNTLSLLLAVVLDGKVLGQSAFRAAFYLPHIISLIVAGFIWRFIFSRTFGALYDATGIPVFEWSWLGDGKLAFVGVVLVSFWQAVGFYIVVYLAGLQTVPRELLEAATIDGAGSVRRFLRVTLPLLMPSVTVSVFYSISTSLKAFDVIFSLTAGGPGTATTSVALHIYQTAFIYSNFGYGTAQSVFLFLFILAVTLFQLTVFKSREVEV